MSSDAGATYGKAAASDALDALARFAEWGEPKRPVRLCVACLADFEALAALGDGLAVVTELGGAVRGQAGLLLSDATVGELLRRLVGERPKGSLDALARSALCEAGNIAASAASGALGHLAGGVVIPSIPRLAALLDDALDPELLPEGGRRARHPVYLVETELGEPGAEVTVTFVWVPAA